MNYSQFLTKTSAARKPSAIRALQKFLAAPGMISLGGGNPHPSTFPFQSIQVSLKDGKTLELKNVEKALQYSPTAGLEDLIGWLSRLQTHQHRPQVDFSICLGTGSQDVLTKAFDMLIEKDDSLLIEAPAYVGSLAYLKPLGCKFVELAVDKQGIHPHQLHSILSNWNRDSPFPRVLYSVPTGNNPTGYSTSLERKKDIYKIAQEFNLLILEDDPYYYVQFSTPRVPSYFSMDVDGRVLRFDSFSKILSAGVRVGWVTGPKELVEKIVLHSQTTSLHTSGVSQLLVSSLLNEWGLDGFYKHVDEVSSFYLEKRNMFLRSAERHLNGLATWETPAAGMFVWLNLLGIQDSAELIREKAVEKKVLLVPGFEFFPNEQKTNYVRAAYSTASESEIDQALERLASLLKR